MVVVARRQRRVVAALDADEAILFDELGQSYRCDEHYIRIGSAQKFRDSRSLGLLTIITTHLPMYSTNSITGTPRTFYCVSHFD